MKTIKEVLDFCNEITFYNHYKIKRVIELNHVRVCLISVLCKCDLISEDKNIRLLGVIDDIPLIFTDEILKSLFEKRII